MADFSCWGLPDAYFLHHDARVEEIDSEGLLPGGSRWQGDGAEGIAAQHVPPPFGGEVVGVDGEHLERSLAAQLHGIACVAPLVDVECGQRENVDGAVGWCYVEVVFQVGCSLALLRSQKGWKCKENSQ